MIPTFSQRKKDTPMMYGTNRNRARGNPDLLLQRRALLIVCIVLLGVVAALGFVAIRHGAYRDRAEMQFAQRMLTAANDAIYQVDHNLSGTVTSNTAATLARIRQYVYYAEQLNKLTISLSGEGRRLAPDHFFSTLYSDLDAYDAVVQQSTVSTRDIQHQLRYHLVQLQTTLIGN